MDEDLPKQPVRDRWSDVESDLEALAVDLDADGWTTVTLHAGDVTTIPPDSDRTGFDVVVPGNEFEVLEEQLETGAAFEETAVFREASGGVAFLVFVLRDPERRAAVLVPAFYPQRGRDARALADHALEAGAVDVHVRPLSRERVVTFTVEAPELVFPEGPTER